MAKKTETLIFVAKDAHGQVAAVSFTRQDLIGYETPHISEHKVKDRKTSTLAQFLLRLSGFQSKGGKARLKTTTAAQRSKWARAAAMARHHKPDTSLSNDA